ncbi:DUF6894 family protein [Methylobacterium planeticum]|uniref:DUF6894 domain-containing protein n=1 Tax=Methylobacterium planeticum TaxID=2615211 RepID=A0A6N6MZR1_9HYPH|nr:hypothetical protein [Methylobacterium planeticum]KAB1076114.1 hypothetical protein F6X51_00810 [Methylobacterium planeticum]
MPRFFLHFKTPIETHRDEEGSVFPSLEDAYLDVCDAIPDIAADLWRSALRARNDDPIRCSFEIADAQGRILMEVPFAEILDPQRYRRQAVLRPDLC